MLMNNLTDKFWNSQDFHQDQVQTNKTKTIFVLEAPRDQFLSLEDYITALAVSFATECAI